jgi:hypothetical protein
MALISCPECKSAASRGGFHLWQILVAIVLFPAGLLALFLGRAPSECPRCQFRWLP